MTIRQVYQHRQGDVSGRAGVSAPIAARALLARNGSTTHESARRWVACAIAVALAVAAALVVIAGDAASAPGAAAPSAAMSSADSWRRRDVKAEMGVPQAIRPWHPESF